MKSSGGTKKMEEKGQNIKYPYLEKASNDVFLNDVYNCKMISFDFIDVKTSPIPNVLEKVGFIDVIKNKLIGGSSEFIYDDYKSEEMLTNG